MTAARTHAPGVSSLSGLITQRNSSPETIAAYRDAFRLLLALRVSSRPASRRIELDIDDLDAPLIGAFLTHLEDRAGQQPENPQRQAGSDPLASTGSRPCDHPEHAAHDRQGDGDPDQALPAQHRRLPRPRRDQGAARRARPDAPGSAAATTRCWLTHDPNRACASRNSPACASATRTSAAARTSGCSGKGRKESERRP